MTQESAISDEMRAAINVESEPYTNAVEQGAIEKFARAIGDTNPLFSDEAAARKSRYGGIIAPPTFFRSLRSGPSKVDVQSPYPANLDGGSEWEYFEPVRPGDRITVTTYLANAFERAGRLGNMLFMVRETKYVNQFDTVVALQRSTGISYQPPEGE
ncbi:MAG: MaoC family dehydratase N-terminal domain-containing protein [SAR202 cluster bacterium]|jgi:acyl dehydratase|nr:MaoC family dehydratase N-terminal domain-containing protein [SAR202 cluster bacterium]|tara:strand:+ start:1165 stop:1635 length:471 start_codon:yes stop_codon:yes gene_type:complete